MPAKKGKKDALVSGPKFIPMPRTWPGKISNEDLFNQFAQEVRAKIAAENAYPFVRLRVLQLGFEKYHDFILSVPKSTTIFQLQCKIGAIQLGGAVLPEDIIIFRKKVKTPAEYRLDPDNPGKVIWQDDLLIGIPRENACEVGSKSLLEFFPDMANFKCDAEQVSKHPQFLHRLRDVPYESVLKTPKVYEDSAPWSESAHAVLNTKLAIDELKYDPPYYELFYDVLPYTRIRPYMKDYQPEHYDTFDWFSPEALLHHNDVPLVDTKVEYHNALLDSNTGKVLVKEPKRPQSAKLEVAVPTPGPSLRQSSVRSKFRRVSLALYFTSGVKNMAAKSQKDAISPK